MQCVRTAIVGMGIGRANGRAIAANPRGKVVALCDLLEDRMRDFARELPDPVTFYTDYRKMCQDPEIDAVFVGTPNQWHVPIALEAVRNGKHVLVTKPLADCEEAARELVEAAEAAGVVNMMSLGIRFSNPVQYLGRLREQGEFGEVYYARAQSLRRSGIPDWNLGFIQKGGGAFRDMGVHVLDSAWWLMGMPKPVSVLGAAGARFGPRGQGFWDYRRPAPEHYRQYAADDYGGGFIRFENGAGLQVESFWACHLPDAGETQIELFGTEAGARLRPLTVYRTVNDAPQDITVEVPQTPGGFDLVADNFIAAILDGAECQAPLRHGLIVQQMMEALLESGETGREVRLD
ncbi:MAG TPA: Gfo/Idh/MocA family oxidoreductase [Chloroflexi bacterium]|jgi:predicted dehydrogenase|nr:Gfo/Idh/MocA family oxidoreductase [Chloroflexota bacterium]